MEFTTYIEINDEELEVEVTFAVNPACFGRRGAYGELMEPDEAAYVEIEKVMHGEKDIMYQLSQKDLITLEEKCMKDAEDQADDAKISAYESQMLDEN